VYEAETVDKMTSVVRILLFEDDITNVYFNIYVNFSSVLRTQTVSEFPFYINNASPLWSQPLCLGYHFIV